MHGVTDKRKAQLKNRVMQGKGAIPLSAQDYARLNDNDKQGLREVLAEEGVDPDEYEENMKRLWPREVVHKTKWRTR